MQITSGAVRTLEDRFQKLFNDDYAIALQNLWWDKLATVKPSTGKKEIYQFLLTNSFLKELPEGQMIYDNLITQAFSGTNKDFGTGLKITKNQFDDDEFQFAADWAAQAGSAIALHPQQLVIDLIVKGTSQNSYDGVSFFSDSHPTNPGNVALGTFSNLIPSTALTYDNYVVGLKTMRSYKMPSGLNRNLVPKYLVGPPSKMKEMLEITGAAFVSTTAQGGPSSNVFNNQGVEPIIINELETDDPDTGAWYLVASNAGSSIGPFIYQLRTAFAMTSYSGATTAELQRTNELEWLIRGRDTALYGHPYQMIKFTP